jgi:RNA polymerase sigma factor (sigma-70 family)
LSFTFLNHWRQSCLQAYSDSTLCEECLTGNEEAWGALLARYQNLIYSVALKFHLNEEEASDIFQAVVIDLYKGLEKLRDRDKLKGWLIAVTRHRCLRYKENRVIAPFSFDLLDETALELSDPREQAQDWLLALEEESILREAIGQLSHRCRDLIHWLFYSDPIPQYREVAERMGVATNSVGFIRERCMRKLRALLEKAGFSRAPMKENPAALPGETDD